MDGEGAAGVATLQQALYWKRTYTEILAMAEKAPARIRQLMLTQSDVARREVELTNVLMVVTQPRGFSSAWATGKRGCGSSTRRSRSSHRPRRGARTPQRC